MAEYIERKKLEEWILNECASLDTAVDREYVVKRLKEDIPSADVQSVVRGEWVKADVAHQIRKKFQPECCSVCRRGKRGNWNFCPNCGADMRGKNNDSL